MPFAKIEKIGGRAISGWVEQNLEFCFRLIEVPFSLGVKIGS